ncbi:MAG TPA: dTMP kinase [Polyangia bacterium]|nr:dTMP kinase [Polyangia bacterium]
MAQGRLIVIEGIDGAGTTTQTRLLVEWLNGSGRPAHATREPSDGPVGRLLREIVRGGHGEVSGATMALLFAADRMDHLAREIEPELARGRHVVSDRYYHSSLAYQSEESERAFVEALNAHARRPDLTFLLEVSARDAAARRARAGRAVERYDGPLLQERIAKNYAALAARLAGRERIVVVPGAAPIEEVQRVLRTEVDTLCG